jgi:CIC family chloride channel protein
MAGASPRRSPITRWRRRLLAWWRLRERRGFVPRWLRPSEITLARRFGLATPEDRRFFLLIVAVGVLAGGLGIAVHLLIDTVQWLLWGRGAGIVEAARLAPQWRVVAALAAGGAGVGLVVLLSGEQVGGQGMGMLIESVALSGGKVPPRPVLTRALAAIFTVGSGGSLGREGPMIRLGAMIASQAASRLGLAPHRVKVLVGCGAAAGLAAAYNVPIGGALFAMEVILGNFALEIFGPIVVSSVISTLISRAAQGDAPFYLTQGYSLGSLWEVPAYLGLGLLGALGSLAFGFAVDGAGRAFGRLSALPAAAKPVAGLALVGLLALAVPEVLAGGYETIAGALGGELAAGSLLVLAAAKLLATALTAGGGGAGGLFTPGLFFGAVLGGAYGHGVAALLPGSASPGAYAAVGMAAVAAGTSHAPISAILILFEFTGNYGLILPLMLASITASSVARALYPYSIYTASLQRRGVDPSWRMGEAVLAGLAVKDLARPDPESLSPADPYPEVVEAFLRSRRQRLFVVEEDGRLVGGVSLHDIKHALEQPETLTAVVAHDLAVPVDGVVEEDERLHRAAERLARSDFERLPVVDGEGRFRGVLAKRDVLAVYAQEVVGRPALLATFISAGEEGASRDYVELPPDFALRLVPVPAELVGRTLAEARLPQTTGARVIEIKRESPRGETRRVIPGGDTRLLAGDLLIVLGPVAQVEALGRGELPAAEAAAHQAID